jgi:hypothetical protein
MSTRVYRATTDLPKAYPPELSPAGRFPPPPDPPPNSHNFLSRMSPSPITVPTNSIPPLIRKNSRNQFTTDFPKMSPSPITVPPVLSPSPIPKSKKQKVQFQPNLSYNKEVDIHWYNDSPITKSQYNWLVDRHKKGLEIPEIFTYQTKILYKEEFDGTCWFKGYKISCETYDGLNEEQNANTKKLAKSHTKPGLYRDPLERFTLLWLREIGQGEAALNKNKNIERDWHLLKYGPTTAYWGVTIEPGTPGDVSNDISTIDNIIKTKIMKEFNEEEYELLKRYYNKDEYKTESNNVYKEIIDAIAIVKTDNSTEKDNAFTYLKEKYRGIDDDFIIGGKKRKQTIKRKKSKRKTNRKTNRKRKTNTRGKSRKK